MADEIDTRVTPSLHPTNVQEVDGYCDEVAGILQSAQAAFTTAYHGLSAIHDAREKARQNPSWNEVEQAVQTADFADKVVERITRSFDSATANLKTIAEGLEKELSAPIDASSYGVIAGEIRAHVKGLKPAERMGFVMQLIRSGDQRSAKAILGGPAFLSGLEPEMQSVLLRMFHEQHEPVKANRLKVAKGAIDLIDQRAGLIWAERDKAVGENPHKIAKWRIQRAAAAQAFTLPKA